MNKLLLILLSLLLASCTKSTTPVADLCPLCATTGAAHADIDDREITSQHQQLIERLRANGVQVIVLGDQISLTFPSERVFIGQTPASISSYNTVLNRIALLLRDYEKISVKVAAYTDAQECSERSLALTRAQARRIASYLWEQGVDARLLVAVGYGQTNPIASNSTASGRALNRRIEITLRQLPG